jgi:hydrogenase expression/formation protein HypC
MCLGIPGQVVSLVDASGLRMGKVKFGGIIREACLEYVPEASVGDYVIVHAGFAISKVDEEEAARTYQLLEEMGQLAELQQSEAESGMSSQGPADAEQD